MKMLRKFFKLPAKDMLLFAEALCLLYLAKGMLIILPFKTCIRTVKSGKSGGIADRDKLKQLKAAISRANKLALWKNVCLVQSFAASWMLQRRKIKSTFLIGVNHDSGKKLIAHAWLKVNDFEIVPQGGNYITISSH
jgi:hypothetical protein